MERWLPVPGYEGAYEVSDLGRVRSLDRLDAAGRPRQGLVLRLTPEATGYYRLYTGGKPRRSFYVHRLVLLAFVGPPPSGAHALHGDGDPLNNALSNLRWGTVSENQADSVRHGRHRNTAKTHCPAGHPYDEVNTFVPRGTKNRKCRTCIRARGRIADRRRAQAKKEMAAK